ncbi:MAG TPA: MipA/OmpV family protein [Steroidobacteraceae bacterium]
MRNLFFAYVIAAAAVASTARASPADDCDAESQDCAVVGKWNFSLALGAGVRTNPLVHGQDLPLVVVPQISYYGKRFYLDDLDLGFTAVDGKTSSLSLIASPGYDRIFFYRSDLQNIFVNVGGASGTRPFPSRSRSITYLAGPEWTFNDGGIIGQFDLLHEITGHNHGDEVRGAIKIPVIRSTGALSATVGLTWQSAAIVNYYYGAPGIYESGSALRPFLKLGYTRPLGKGWRLEGIAQYEHLANAIADSPIVAHNHVVTSFLGFVRAF